MFVELVKKLLEEYAQVLQRGGLSPERIPEVLQCAQYTLASLLASDLIKL